MTATGIVMLLLGLALGFALGVLWTRNRDAERIATLAAERQAALDRIQLVEARDRDQRQLAESFSTLSAEALRRNSTELLAVADHQLGAASRPIMATLERLDSRLREIEHARVRAEAALAEQIETVRHSGEALRTETAALVTALRKPQVRGQWGEMHLRRAVEIAGLVDRCDFETQATMTDEDGTQRPDLVVHLAGDKHIVVDAKVPLAAFLEAAEARDEAVREERMRAHARALRTHVDQLGAKAYWRRLDALGLPTPEFVVLFVPGEAFLSQAVEHDAELLEYSARKRVMIATPTTLITLLRTVAYAWTQDALAANARQVFELGRELYGRLGTLGEHVDRVGRSLNNAVSSYNKAVGSLESRVLVTARRLHGLRIVDAELAEPTQVDAMARTLSAPELTDRQDAIGVISPSTSSEATLPSEHTAHVNGTSVIRTNGSEPEPAGGQQPRGALTEL
jgi:DNA recombination protein RmuC